MSRRERVQRVVDAFIGNPYVLTDSERGAAEDALDELDLAPTVAGLLADGDPTLAEQLLLAVGHVQACRPDADRKSVLDQRSLPRHLIPKLPRSRNAYLRIAMAAGRARAALDAMRGGSDAMQQVRAEVWGACFGRSLRHALLLERVMRDDDIVVLGETGTGKEKIAEAIQAATPGPDDGSAAPHASINAAAIPDTLVESELFGHIKGAFTGATDNRTGQVRAADGGCFFLDEVGDLPQQTQVKLLRVLELDRVSPVGSDAVHQVDVRFVAATHRDIEAMVDAGDFRRDLYQPSPTSSVGSPLREPRPTRGRATSASCRTSCARFCSGSSRTSAPTARWRRATRRARCLPSSTAARPPSGRWRIGTSVA
jgi:hypothetical protein